jgi:hypothetical protein
MYERAIPLGRLVATAAVASTLAQDQNLSSMIFGWLKLHERGECPHLDQEDRASNRRAIANGERVLTSWPTGRRDEPKLWIITEADRSATTLLWPSDY